MPALLAAFAHSEPSETIYPMWPKGKVYQLADPRIEKQNIHKIQSAAEGEMPEREETYGEVVKHQPNRAQDNDLVSSRRYAVSKAESCESKNAVKSSECYL